MRAAGLDLHRSGSKIHRNSGQILPKNPSAYDLVINEK
jgi:hypothetical protein